MGLVALETADLIIKIGAVAGAITAVIVLYVKIRNAIKTFVGFFKEMRTDLSTVIKHDKQQYLSILRLTVMSTDMPISERIIAGQQYIDLGGNGDVKKFYENYLKHLEDMEG